MKLIVIKAFCGIFILLGGIALGIGPVISEALPADSSILFKPTNSDHRRFNMEFRDAELKDVLRALGQEQGLNIIVSDDVDGKLTLSFKNVTLEEALEAILRVQNLISFRDGGIIRVAKSPFVEGEELLVTRMIPINFASVQEIATTIKGLLSKKGSVSTDIRTNTLLVRDVPAVVERITEIIKKIDSKTPQVMIEARIVEATTDFRRDLGVQWGARREVRTSSGASVVSGLTQTGGTGLSGNNFIVNLPAAIGTGLGGGLGFTFGNLANTFDLDLQLSALEVSGRGKVLSNPRILALDNKVAKISTGTEILIPVTSVVTGVSAGATPSDGGGGSITSGVTTIDAKLELAVTPHVTPDGQILMHVKLDKKDPDFARQVQDVPPLNTRSAETDLLVKDGETIVIGGIYTKNESKNVAGVPWFHRIPVLGWLFKKEVKTETQTELLIFITPTVYK